MNKRFTYTQRQSTADLRNRKTDIEFIGVWDTVAAYGTPFIELTRAIDDWVWPLSLPDYQLSTKVRRARHALALDDERDTFHPLLWDERNEKVPERLTQVWFAGMHSDVGGGYPDDALAYVSLDWMRQQLPELRFKQKAVERMHLLKDSCGPLHDSRRGIGGYYRYQPRKLSACVDPPDPTTQSMQNPDSHARALLTSVKIHHSVFDRIHHGTDRYAPIVLPDAYEVADGHSAGVEIRGESAPADRAADQESVWDWVWHNRVNYFVTVFVSLWLVAFPLWQILAPPIACIGVHCVLSPAIESVGSFLPGFAKLWIAAFARTPGLFTIGVLVLVLLLLRSSMLQARIRDNMRGLWENSLGLTRPSAPIKRAARWVRPLRTSPRYQRGFQVLKWHILPNAFGRMLLGLVAVLILLAFTVGTLRTGIWYAESSGAWCDESQQGSQFMTSRPCWPVGARVQAGTRYRVHLTVSPNTGWRDLQIDASPEGFDETRMSAFGNLLTPLRRSISARWFQPVAKIIPQTGKPVVLPLEFVRADTTEPQYVAQFTAPKSGRLYLFVNDVLLPPWLPRATLFYDNNQGGATIDVEAVQQW